MNFFEWNLECIIEINLYISNHQFTIFVGKFDDNDYYYDFIENKTETIDKCLNKFKFAPEKLSIKFHLNSHYELINELFTNNKQHNIYLEIYEDHSFFKNLFQNSLFFIEPSDFTASFSNFEKFSAFKYVQNIHIFADDLMSSIGNLDTIKTTSELYEKEKIKTFLFTIDSNQCWNNASLIHTLKNVDFEFEIENLNNILRCNKKIFDYLMPFYEYYNYLNFIDKPFFKKFNSFLELKLHINAELMSIKRKNTKMNKNERINKHMGSLVDIITNLPWLEIKCPNNADGVVEEISVTSEQLLNSVKAAIDEAVAASAKKSEIAVIINYSYNVVDYEDSLKEKFQTDNSFEEFVGDFIEGLDDLEKYSENPFNLAINLLKNPKVLNHTLSLLKENKFQNLTNSMFKNSLQISENAVLTSLLKMDYSDKCDIIPLINLKFNNEIKHLFSSEYKYVIYVLPRECFLFNSSYDADESFVERMGHYYAMSRARMNLKIIYAMKPIPIVDDELD